MKKIIYYSVFGFSVLIFSACGHKSNDTRATGKKQDGPVIELKEEIQAPASDTTVIKKDSTERK